MNFTPCPLCGYEATGTTCPHCELKSTDPSFSKPPGDPLTAVIDGLRAVPTGLYLLLTTRGVKRLMAPPVIITGVVFFAFLYFLLSFMFQFIEAINLEDPSELDIDTEWIRTSVEWLMSVRIAAWSAQAAGWLVALVTSFFLMWWVGSIVYEAIAGPFLDEIQGRFEVKWFGRNPRNEIERPTNLPTARCSLLSVVAGIPAFACLALWWVSSGILAVFFFMLIPVPFVVLGVAVREYGIWLWWVVRVEGRTLLVSLKASLLAAVFLIPAIAIKFIVPIIGPFIFILIAGFATALTLLDIPFSRRQWPLKLRVRFLFLNLPAMIGFGAVSALLFAVPIFGPLLMVPSASIGGLWLVCRLDKNSLRPKGQKIART